MGPGARHGRVGIGNQLSGPRRADANIRKFLDEQALAHTFDLHRQLRAVDAIFPRVFGAKTAVAI